MNGIYNFSDVFDKFFRIEKLPSQFKKYYHKLILKNLCYYPGDLFTNSNNNNKLVKNNISCNITTGTTASYGLNILQSYYIEELRNQLNLYEYLLKRANESGYEYNNTLYGSDFEIEEDGNYSLYDPFYIFNSEKVYYLKIIRKYFLSTIYKDVIRKFYNSMYNFWNRISKIYKISMIIFIILFSFLFFIYWIPFIYKQDLDIYKTKNMLSIIPKDVLASISNIGKLLNIGNFSMISNNEENDVNEKK